MANDPQEFLEKEQTYIRIDKSVKIRLIQMAKNQHRTISGQIAHLLDLATQEVEAIGEVSE